MFSTECKKYVCPNMTHILSAYPDNRIMCIENGKTITQKRILQAELIGQIFNSEPKLQFGLENNNLSKNIETKQHVSAKTCNWQLQEDQHSPILTRTKIIKKSKLSSKLSLSDYQLKEYHYFETPVVKLELESYPIKSLSISHILSNFYQ